MSATNRIVWLDTARERDVAHVVTEATDVTSYVLTGERKHQAYGYLASSVIRRATMEEVEAWIFQSSVKERLQ